jgi:leader peptidase (prepilin peptidase)/N-methyltransferase
MPRALAETAPAAALAAVCLFGLAIGSLLNVVIVRLPEGRSLWRPGSACPGCATPIAWYDNIPLLSFALLRGRCRACAMPIAWRYPLVEAVTGAAFLAAYAAFGPTARFVVAAALLAALIAITAIDLRLQIIPNAITLPGIVAGVLANLCTGAVSWRDAVTGALVGGGVFVAIILGYALLFRDEGMGLGDAKLSAMLGAFLGWKTLLFSLFVAVMVGGVLAIVLLATGLRGRKDPIPFGPFLALGGATGLFWGEKVVAWYLSGFGS